MLFVCFVSQSTASPGSIRTISSGSTACLHIGHSPELSTSSVNSVYEAGKAQEGQRHICGKQDKTFACTRERNFVCVHVSRRRVHARIHCGRGGVKGGALFT